MYTAHLTMALTKAAAPVATVCLAHTRFLALASSPSPFKPMMAALFHYCWCLVLA